MVEQYDDVNDEHDKRLPYLFASPPAGFLLSFGHSQQQEHSWSNKKVVIP